MFGLTKKMTQQDVAAAAAKLPSALRDEVLAALGC